LLRVKAWRKAREYQHLRKAADAVLTVFRRGEEPVSGAAAYALIDKEDQPLTDMILKGMYPQGIISRRRFERGEHSGSITFSLLVAICHSVMALLELSWSHRYTKLEFSWSIASLPLEPYHEHGHSWYLIRDQYGLRFERGFSGLQT